jgi:tetratricopeptide (TPR) repeat protein
MKFRFSTKIFYPAFFLILLVGVVLVTQFEKEKTKTPLSSVQDKQMPMDDVHKNMGNADAPTRANVNENFRKQLENLKQKIEVNPKDTLALREYADLLNEGHKPLEAIQYYEKILSFNPKRTDVLFNLSIIYFNNKDLNKAEEFTNRILSFDKNNDQAHYNIGAISAAKGDREKARTIWEDLIKKYPGSPTAILAASSLERL